MSWDKMVSRTRKKRAGKGVAEAASATTSTSNADDVEDDACSAAPPAPLPGAIKSAVDVTAIVASSSALEDDDEGAVYADAVDVSDLIDFFLFFIASGRPSLLCSPLFFLPGIAKDFAGVVCEGPSATSSVLPSHASKTSSSLATCDSEIEMAPGRGRKKRDESGLFFFLLGLPASFPK